MKTIIAGGRNVTRIADVIDAIHACPWSHGINHVIHGGASGVDENAGWVTECVGLLLPQVSLIQIERPDYDRYPGRIAPIMRNRKMAEMAEALILVWDGKSRGSANMLDEANRRNLRIFEHLVK